MLRSGLLFRIDIHISQLQEQSQTTVGFCVATAALQRYGDPSHDLVHVVLQDLEVSQEQTASMYTILSIEADERGDAGIPSDMGTAAY